jgi:hypothetical protein
MHSTLLRTVALSFFTATSAFAQASDAIARTPEVLRPGNLSTAPRNTKVWFETFDTAAVLTLETAAGVSVPLTKTSIPLNAQFGAVVHVFTPMTLLDANTTYVVKNSISTFESGRFTTTAEIDTTPPPALGVTVTQQLGAIKNGAGSEVLLTFDATPEYAIVGEEGQTWQPETALNASDSRSVALLYMPPGQKKLVAFNVDLAGNATPSTVVSATVPPERSCSVSGALPLVALALTLVRRRRAA